MSIAASALPGGRLEMNLLGAQGEIDRHQSVDLVSECPGMVTGSATSGIQQGRPGRVLAVDTRVETKVLDHVTALRRATGDTDHPRTAQRFIDLPRSPLWLGEENVVVGAV